MTPFEDEIEEEKKIWYANFTAQKYSILKRKFEEIPFKHCAKTF